MAQANVIHITKPERDVAQAQAFRDLESGICDISSMAGLVSSHLEDVVCHLKKGLPLDGSEAERIMFGAYHLEEMIAAVKRGYYENYNS
jgi:hypothetical protein